MGPAIGAWLSSAGAPTWLSSLFASAPGYIAKGASWLWDGVGSAAGSAWKGFAALPFGTQAAIVAGTAALVAPEETVELVKEVGNTVGDAASSVIEGVTGFKIGGVPWWVWLVGGYVTYKVVKGDDR